MTLQAAMHPGQRQSHFPPLRFQLKIRKDFPAVGHSETDRPSCEFPITGRDLWRIHAPSRQLDYKTRVSWNAGFCDSEPILSSGSEAVGSPIRLLSLNFLRFLTSQSKSDSWYHFTRWKFCISLHNQEISSESQITITTAVSFSVPFQTRTHASL